MGSFLPLPVGCARIQRKLPSATNGMLPLPSGRYRTAPHVDVLHTRRKAVAMLAGCLRRRQRPVLAYVALPLGVSGEMSNTADEPCRTLYSETLHAVDVIPGVLDASILIGYVWARGAVGGRWPTLDSLPSGLVGVGRWSLDAGRQRRGAAVADPRLVPCCATPRRWDGAAPWLHCSTSLTPSTTLCRHRARCVRFVLPTLNLVSG